VSTLSINVPPGPYTIKIYNVCLGSIHADYSTQIASVPYNISLPSGTHDFLVHIIDLYGGDIFCISDNRSGYLEGAPDSEESEYSAYLIGGKADYRQAFVKSDTYRGLIPGFKYIGDF